jgi:hypothetical protein
MEGAVLVDGSLTVAFVVLAAYFFTLDDLLIAGVWVLVAAAFAARAAGVLPRV